MVSSSFLQSVES